MKSQWLSPYTWRDRLAARLSNWLAHESRPLGAPRNDFGRLCEHLLFADIVLVEGRSRMSGVIQSVTLSSWTHAALYVGRLADLGAREQALRLRAQGVGADTPVLLEAEVGRGVILSPITRYAREHLRLCRARELDAADAERVVAYALEHLGTPYDLRQIADLLRFFFPYGVLPRRWRSSLFEMSPSTMSHTICSTLIARSFAYVRYPILPTLHRGRRGEVVFHRRNARLIVPRDFDYSPYFDIIKYPFFGDDVARYRELAWEDDAQP